MDFIAESVLVNAQIPTQWQGTVKKIDIDALIEFEYGLDIEWRDIDHFAPDAQVLAAIVPKRKLIYMNETKQLLFIEKMGTMNFSKAHELGHWILHVTEQRSYEQLSFQDHQTFICRSMYNKPPEEVQADMFAASILMPREIIRGAIGKLKENGPVTFQDLYTMKDNFEVSISALVTRVQTLGLLFISNKKVYSSEEDAYGQISLF